MSEQIKYPRFHKMTKSELLEELRNTKMENTKLKAEIEQLKAENAQLKAENGRGMKRWLDSECDRLKAERDMLKLCANCEQYFGNTCGQSDSSGCGYCDAWDLRKGLQPKGQGDE